MPLGTVPSMVDPEDVVRSMTSRKADGTGALQVEQLKLHLNVDVEILRIRRGRLERGQSVSEVKISRSSTLTRID